MGAGHSGSPFVGRWAEVRALRALAATSRRDGPAGGMVVGPPGLGKSRLLGEVVKELDRRCVRVQGYQTARDIALGAAGGLLRELARAPEIGARLDDLLVGGSGNALAPESRAPDMGDGNHEMPGRSLTEKRSTRSVPG